MVEIDVDKNQVAWVTLSRPEVHNAFDDTFIEAVTDCFEMLGERREVRLVLLKGEGRSFCAGADLAWMKAQGEASMLENQASGLKMARMFEAIARCPAMTIAAVGGPALGGGMGLVCACDISIGCRENALLGLTESRLGIIPAVIFPYVVGRVGESQARYLSLLGLRLKAQEALERGVLHAINQEGNTFEELIDQTIAHGLKSSSQAQRQIKKMLSALPRFERKSRPELLRYTARQTAVARASRDGREGMKAFLEKRRPSWHPGAKA